MFVFKPGTLIIIGVLSLVVGFVPPISILCIASGLACVLFGIDGLKKEVDAEQLEAEQSEDGDKNAD